MSQYTKIYQMCQTDFPILQFPVTTDVRFQADLHVKHCFIARDES